MVSECRLHEVQWSPDMIQMDRTTPSKQLLFNCIGSIHHYGKQLRLASSKKTVTDVSKQHLESSESLEGMDFYCSSKCLLEHSYSLGYCC